MSQIQTQAPALASPKVKMQNLRSMLEKSRASIAAVLPKHLDADRMLKLALVAASQNPDLLNCTPESVIRSVMIAGQLGLDCSGALGSAYLVPFKRECQLIIGYRGMIDLVRRAGELSQIEARVVYSADEFELEYGMQPKFRHVPKLDGDRGRPRLAYCIARLRDGSTHVEVMTMDELERVRASSRSGSSGPWSQWPDEMRKKTVVRRAFKYLPVSIEKAGDARRVEAAEALAEGEAGDFSDILALPPAEPSAIAEAVAAGEQHAEAAQDRQDDRSPVGDVVPSAKDEARKEAPSASEPFTAEEREQIAAKERDEMRAAVVLPAAPKGNAADVRTRRGR